MRVEALRRVRFALVSDSYGRDCIAIKVPGKYLIS